LKILAEHDARRQHAESDIFCFAEGMHGRNLTPLIEQHLNAARAHVGVVLGEGSEVPERVDVRGLHEILPHLRRQLVAHLRVDVSRHDDQQHVFHDGADGCRPFRRFPFP
jgi:hypothetical protein